MDAGDRRRRGLRTAIATMIVLAVIVAGAVTYVGMMRGVPLADGIIIEATLSQLEEIFSDHKELFLYFYSPTCPACAVYEPVLAREVVERGVTMARLDLSNPANEELVARYRIRVVPTVMFYLRGGFVERFDGHKPEEEIVEFVERMLR